MDFKEKFFINLENWIVILFFSDDIKQVTKNEEIIIHKLDTSCLTSVRSFAQKILETEKSLHILVSSYLNEVLKGKMTWLNFTLH